MSKIKEEVFGFNKVGTSKTIEVIDDYEGTAQWVKITFFEPLVKLFEGNIFGKNDKLDELYHYFTSLDDEVEINKSRSEESGTVFQKAFRWPWT